jgi:hypothetical protein
VNIANIIPIQEKRQPQLLCQGCNSFFPFLTLGILLSLFALVSHGTFPIPLEHVSNDQRSTLDGKILFSIGLTHISWFLPLVDGISGCLIAVASKEDNCFGIVFAIETEFPHMGFGIATARSAEY